MGALKDMAAYRMDVALLCVWFCHRCWVATCPSFLDHVVAPLCPKMMDIHTFSYLWNCLFEASLSVDALASQVHGALNLVSWAWAGARWHGTALHMRRFLPRWKEGTQHKTFMTYNAQAELDCEVLPEAWKLERNWSQEEACLSKVEGATDIRLAFLFKGRLGVGRLENEVGAEVDKLPPVDEDVDCEGVAPLQGSPGQGASSPEEASRHAKRIKVVGVEGILGAGDASAESQSSAGAAEEIAKALSFEQLPLGGSAAASLRSAAPPA